MTTFGIDLSHYQDLNLGALTKQGFDFFAAKVTEGANYVDSTYAGNLAEAKAAGALFAAYHFVRSDASAAAQADNIARHIIDKSVPVMLDLEPSGSSRPTLGLANSIRSELRQRGIRASILYFPHFWWTDQGSPSLKGWAVWQAEYPSSKHLYASALYSNDGGDKGEGFNPEGGVVPVIWQFASSAKVDGYSGNVDVDAFAGSRADLAATGIFKDFGFTPAPRPVTPKPKGPTRVAQFHTEFETKNVADVHLLDVAVRGGRRGTVRQVRNALVVAASQVPFDSPLTRRFHAKFAKTRVIDLNLLETAVKRGRKGTILNVLGEINRQVAKLPKA